MTGTGSCHTHSYTPHYGNDVPFEVPESWVWCKLIDVCHIFGRIGFRGYTKDDFVSNDGAITLSPSNIIDGQMNYDNCSYISWEKYEESPEIQIANGDILLVKTGSSFGKCAYVCNLPQKATINPQFVVLKYILCNPVFLTYMLQSGYARRNYDEFVLGTAIPTFTQAALGNMYIPLPSKQEQQRIVNAIGQWFKFIDDLEKEQNGLQRLFQLTKSKILDLAIHGKLVPQDPDDEPAIELLKRINPSFVPCDNGHYENIPEGWTVCTLEEIIDYEQPQAYIVQSTDYKSQYKIPVLTAGKSFIIGYTNETEGVFTDLPVIIFDDFTTDSKFVDFPFKVKSSAMKILHVKDGINIQYVCQFMSITRLIGDTHKRYWISEYSKLPIPIPPSAEQSRIINKINELFQILDNISAEL